MISKCVLQYYSVRSSQPPFKVDRHLHEYWEMVYYDGTGISTVNGKPLHYLPGTYVLIPSNVAHSEYALSHTDLFVLGFEAELESDEFPTVLFADDNRRTIKKLLQIIGNEVSQEPAYSSEYMNLLMREILLLSLRSCAPKVKKSDRKLDMIINYIDTYCTTDIDYRALANSMNYSYDHLRHYFKAKKQMSLKQYTILKRIDKAKEKLATGTAISKVATDCGFSSTAYFSSVFHKTVGMSPSEYQEKARSISDSGNIYFINRK